jgi:hypothetical protein
VFLGAGLQRLALQGFGCGKSHFLFLFLCECEDAPSMELACCFIAPRTGAKNMTF